MTDPWWQLPGPARFVEGVVRSLRDGICIVLCLPEYSPNPVPALRRALEDDWYQKEIHLEDDPLRAAPVDFLLDRFGVTPPPDKIRTVSIITELDDFAGTIVYLDGIRPEDWPAWRTFLVDYAHACRSTPLLQRTLFCAKLSGVVALDPPEPDVCLAVHRYDSLQRIDTLLYSWLLIDDAFVSRLEKELAASAIAGIALWDMDLAGRLAEEPIDRILNPGPILHCLAEERGWSSLETIDERELWAMGVKCSMDGVVRLHSAALSVLGRAAEVERRIWSAQVGVLFPFVEEGRQQIVQELASVLRVPFTPNKGETIHDLRDLEIGHIEWQLRGLRHVGDEMRRLIGKLKQIRNALSHLEIVPAELLRAPEFSRLSSQ